MPWLRSHWRVTVLEYVLEVLPFLVAARIVRASEPHLQRMTCKSCCSGARSRIGSPPLRTKKVLTLTGVCTAERDVSQFGLRYVFGCRLFVRAVDRAFRVVTPSCLGTVTSPQHRKHTRVECELTFGSSASLLLPKSASKQEEEKKQKGRKPDPPSSSISTPRPPPPPSPTPPPPSPPTPPHPPLPLPRGPELH
jgi:hypothetical protein